MQNTSPVSDKTKSGNSNAKWSQTQKAMEEGASTVSDTARQIYDQAVEVGGDFLSQANRRATEVVREYPIYATLGGVCIGFLLGASLVGRRAQREG